MIPSMKPDKPAPERWDMLCYTSATMNASLCSPLENIYKNSSELFSNK